MAIYCLLCPISNVCYSERYPNLSYFILVVLKKDTGILLPLMQYATCEKQLSLSFFGTPIHVHGGWVRWDILEYEVR